METDLNHVHKFFAGNEGHEAYPLILFHGTGGDENDLIYMASQLSPRSPVLAPRGSVMEGSSPRFFRRLEKGVFDMEDLLFRTDEMAEFLGQAARKYGFNLSKALAVGYSNGANIAASILLRHPGLIAGGILFRPMLPYSVEGCIALHGRHVLILSGEDDETVPMSQAVALAETLESSGGRVRHEILPVGHEITDEDLQQARTWISRLKHDA